MPPTPRLLLLLRPSNNSLRTTTNTIKHNRTYTSQTPPTPPISPFAPRHLLSIADLTPTELTTLIRNAASHKSTLKSGGALPPSLRTSLQGQTIALTFSKRSTRTRVSTEAAVNLLGGHPLFLSAADIQLGVNESLHDTAVVVSSMVSAIVARVNAHADVAALATHSSVPVLNALSDTFHPLQTLADFQTLHEAFPSRTRSATGQSLGLEGLKIAWLGDANNVLFDLALGAAKLGCTLSVATPRGYGIPAPIKDLLAAQTPPADPDFLTETHVPEEAVRGADVIVTDTWVSMGQEAETAARVRDFAGFQVTAELARRGGAREGWKFLHCLPRHAEEVSDEVFYSPASLVFQEAENRLWAALAAVEGFVVRKGSIE